MFIIFIFWPLSACRMHTMELGFRAMSIFHLKSKQTENLRESIRRLRY